MACILERDGIPATDVVEEGEWDSAAKALLGHAKVGQALADLVVEVVSIGRH